MNKTATAINIIVALAVVAYLVVASVHYNQRSARNICTVINLEIADNSPFDFVTDSIVRLWIEQSQIKTIGEPILEIKLNQIEQSLKEHQYIDSAEAHTTMLGTLNIHLTQSIPIVRIKTDTGYDFYVDSTLKILPLQSHFRADVPIFSGNIEFEFPHEYYGRLKGEKYVKDTEYLKKVINFVDFIYRDEFLRSFIIQIYANNNGDIELVPRIGEQMIIFGTFDDYVEKLEKLKKFYRNSFFEQWWTKARLVNLKYRQQVIVS